MSRVILGGGLSGLSAAYFSIRNSHDIPVILLEANNRCGGWLKSTRLDDGTIFEQAARTIRPSGVPGANTLQLVEELGLSDEIHAISRSSDAVRNRMVYVNGKLHTLPNSIISLFAKREPFTKPLLFSFAKDLYTSKKTINGHDESIYSFTSRRFGNEVADYLISPMICGVCGGDAKEISVKFLLKNLFENEQKYGSVTKGIIAGLFKTNKQEAIRSNLLNRAKKEKWSVYSFKNGMEVLPLTLLYKIQARGVDVRTNSYIKEIEVMKNSVVCHRADGGIVAGSHAVSAIPAKQLGKLLYRSHPELSNILSEFKTTSICVVNLKYNGDVISTKGFGFLVAPKEKSPLLGVIYDSCCFPSDEKRTVLTVMMGGYKYNEYFKSDPVERNAKETALVELKRILGLSEQPSEVKVSFLNDCIPQYIVGHEDRVRKVERYIEKNNLAMSVCGASYYGVGVNDVIYSAKRAVESIN